MTQIYSSTALVTKLREVKDAAEREIVHITENGNGAFIFCSEELFAQALEEERKKAIRAEQLLQVRRRSRADFAAGRYYEGVEALRAAVRQERGDTHEG